MVYWLDVPYLNLIMEKDLVYSKLDKLFDDYPRQRPPTQAEVPQIVDALVNFIFKIFSCFAIVTGLR